MLHALSLAELEDDDDEDEDRWAYRLRASAHHAHKVNKIHGCRMLGLGFLARTDRLCRNCRPSGRVDP